MSPRSTARRSTVGEYELAAVRYLARRARTEAQVEAFLTRAGASAACIRSLLARFRERGYLDDTAYALRWAQARLARRPMGPARLEAELLAKGFDRTTVAKVMRQVYAGVNQRELARTLLARWPGRRGASLLRRYGFDDEVIEALLGVSASA
jgi:regulatory protein